MLWMILTWSLRYSSIPFCAIIHITMLGLHRFKRSLENPALLIGALILFVAVFGLCGTFFPSSASLTEVSGECGVIALLGNSMSQKELIAGIGLFMLLLVAVLQISSHIWEKERFLQRIRLLLVTPFCNTFFQTKIFHPLLRAFRKGILHSQIYNFAFTVN